MTHHISSVTKSCFFHLRRIRQIKSCLNELCLQTLVQALIISRLDYCNSVLVNLPDSTLHPYTTILHSAARLVKGLKPRDHITPALRQLHWFPTGASFQLFLGGGAKFLFLFFNATGLLKNWTKQHFVCSNLTLFVVPFFFLSFFFFFSLFSFFSFFFLSFFFLFSFFLFPWGGGDGLQPPSNDAPGFPSKLV